MRTPDKTTTWGTWGREARGVVGLQENYSGDSTEGRTDVQSLSVNINSDRYGILSGQINAYKSMGADAWSTWSPCSDFASGVFGATTGIHLQDRHLWGLGYSDPNVLYESIKSH